MIKHILILLVLLGYTDLWAMPDKVSGLKCQKKVEALVASLQPRLLWKKSATNIFSAGYRYRARTKKFANWVHLDVNSATKEAVVVHTGPKKIVEFRFDAACTQQKKQFKRQFQLPKETTRFDDKALKKLLDSGETGIIYAWSPSQIYSSQYFHRFVRAAQDLDIQFEPVLDPLAKFKEASMTAMANGFPLKNRRMTSNELLETGMTIHYPTTLVFHKGILSNYPIVGLLDNDDLRADIRKEIRRLDRIARARKRRKGE